MTFFNTCVLSPLLMTYSSVFQCEAVCLVVFVAVCSRACDSAFCRVCCSACGRVFQGVMQFLFHDVLQFVLQCRSAREIIMMISHRTSVVQCIAA